MLVTVLMIASLLLSLVRFGVLAWAYQRTRLMPVLVYLVWSVLNSFALAPAKKVLIDHALHSGGLFGANVGALVSGMNLMTDGVGSILFLWMLLALVQRVPPLARLPWRGVSIFPPPVSQP